MRPSVILYITGIALISISQHAGQALAQVACGDAITQNTTLNSDLSNCSKMVGGIVRGVVIGAPNITLDLGGHTIDGVGVGNGVDNTAGGERVTIKHGRIREFEVGVSLANATRNRLTDLWSSRNGDGIVLSQSENNQIESNITSDSANTGIALDTKSDNNRVEKNSSFDNVNFGIAVEKTSNDNSIRRNTASDNGGSGIFVESSSTGTQIERNVANRNVADGIFVDNPSASNTLTRNTANNNGVWGINAASGVTDGGGNRAIGNGMAGQCQNVICP
jgi:parallel beta-helix repeat protein